MMCFHHGSQGGYKMAKHRRFYKQAANAAQYYPLVPGLCQFAVIDGEQPVNF